MPNTFDLDTFAAILEETQRRIHLIVETLELAATTGSPRVAMLAGTFGSQMNEISEVVERIQRDAGSRALTRSIARDTPLAPMEALFDGTDSRAMTVWLIDALNALCGSYDAIAGARRLGGVEPLILELCQLFAAQAKRVAMEAHRFEDL